MTGAWSSAPANVSARAAEVETGMHSESVTGVVGGTSGLRKARSRSSISAAVTHKASKSGGIDKALLGTLRNQPLGEILVMLPPRLGLLVFGVYRAVRGPLAESMTGGE